MIVGIDLGTTNSLVAYFTEEGPKIIPNRLGKHLTPSVVSVDKEGNVYVGETARERMSLYPESVAMAFKRSMGTERTYDLCGHRFKPEELSSMVLRALKEDAENFLGEEVTEAVISVPAYFDDKRRKATKRAGELAYLKIQPRDYEENRLVLLRAERMYEESLGERRKKLDFYITAFETALKKGKHEEIETAREELNEMLEQEDE